MNNTEGYIYYRRPTGEKRRETHTKPRGEQVGSPRIPGLHRNIPISTSGNPRIQLNKYRDTEYESIFNMRPEIIDDSPGACSAPWGSP